MNVPTIFADPVTLLTRPVRVKSIILAGVLTLYIAATLVVFFQVVIPSLEDFSANETFAVDTTVYTDLADSVREGRYTPYVVGSLAHFPNTAWMPVLIWLILNNAFLVMLLNYALFTFSILLLRKTFSINLAIFIPLLLLNPTTTTSILCLNKESVDLFCLSLFLYSRVKNKKWILLATLLFALINRYEFCVVMLLFAVAGSRWNPLREKRIATMLLLVAAFNFAIPFWGGKMLAQRFEEAASANTIAFLDRLQMNYLYIIAVIPKIAENLFGQIVNPQVWKAPTAWLIVNLFNNISYLIVITIAAINRRLTLQNDLIYFAVIGALLVAQSLSVQPRYFQFIYVLLCLQIAQLKSQSWVGNTSFPGRGRKRYRASRENQTEAAFG
jgi:hypothetical protein